jgi:DNA-binding MarR family transcriptional regulator
MEDDRVDRLVEDFKRVRPDVDPTTKVVAARLLHLIDLVERYYGGICELFDVSLSGLGVLTSLARNDPRALTLSELNRDILVTSGGMTFLAASLEQQGLVSKRPHPSDGRAVLVKLTRQGRQVANQLIDAIALADVAALTHVCVSDLNAADELLRSLEAGFESAMTAQLDVSSSGRATESSPARSRR